MDVAVNIAAPSDSGPVLAMRQSVHDISADLGGTLTSSRRDGPTVKMVVSVPDSNLGAFINGLMLGAASLSFGGIITSDPTPVMNIYSGNVPPPQFTPG